MEGSLNAYGGKIRFTQTGDYTLTASMTDVLCRMFSYSASTTVCPIPSISLELPQIWYVGEAGTVSVSGTDLDNLTADWTVVKDDGGAEPYSAYASGTLTKAGGTLLREIPVGVYMSSTREKSQEVNAIIQWKC